MAVFLPFLVSTRPTQTTKAKTLGFFFSNLFATSSFFGLFLCVLSKQTSFFCFCCFRKIWTLSENRKKYFKGKKKQRENKQIIFEFDLFLFNCYLFAVYFFVVVEVPAAKCWSCNFFIFFLFRQGGESLRQVQNFCIKKTENFPSI